MNIKYRLIYLCGMFAAVCALLLLPGCSSPKDSAPSSGLSGTRKDAKNGPLRPNTPKVYTPEAAQTAVIGSLPLTIDVSHTDQGYVMALYSGNAAKANIQITGPDGITYKYFISVPDHYVTLPLTGGNGTYQIAAYENITGSKYAVLYKDTLTVRLENEFLPFLYPNQYVDFHSGAKAVSTAAEAVKEASSDLDAVADIYHYVIEHVTYDEEKAQTVPAGYLPDVDSTLESGKGICFDYASLTAAMLRSQNIPARLEIGYSGKIYHAWISVYIKDIGWIDRLIEFTGDAWTRMDPTFASSNNNNKKILEYIGDGSNYTIQYLH